VVEHLPRHPKVTGLSPATLAGARRQKNEILNLTLEKERNKTKRVIVVN
jgi:hypothetical protein